MKFQALSLVAAGLFGQSAAFMAPQFGGAKTTQLASTLADPSGGKIGAMGEQPQFMDIWVKLDPVVIQGGGMLRTWSLPTQTEFAEVLMKTDDRTLNVNFDLWEGPDNTPQSMKLYIGYGNKRPIRNIVATPGDNNAFAIRNIGPLEYPVDACVGLDEGSAGLESLVKSLTENPDVGSLIQGGSISNTPCEQAISSVAIMIKSDGRPVNAKIELLQGPNSVKISLDHYAEDGLLRPLFLIIQTPGAGNTVRIMNSAGQEFPFVAAVVPYRYGPDEWLL